MKKALVTGAAGFLGSHITRELSQQGYEVLAIDNLTSGTWKNLVGINKKRLHVLQEDVRNLDSMRLLDIFGVANEVWHFASPCSPPDYMKFPIETLRVNAEGTQKILEYAADCEASLDDTGSEKNSCIVMLASTSEVYGQPHISPQPESYNGNVNPIGPRSCYDEGKRYAEALAAAYGEKAGTRTRIARIFNSYGPNMRDDGRVVIRFLTASLRGEPIIIHGSGKQTRSFCYVSDTVAGLMALRDHGQDMVPVNIGSDREMTIEELLEEVEKVTGNRVGEVIYTDAMPDDPKCRQPDLSRLRQMGWEPMVPLSTGLRTTAVHLRHSWGV